MIGNPIVRKEVLTSLRTRKAALMQGLFLLVTLALVWLLWPVGGMQDIGGQQARQIFGVLAVGELVLIALFAPAFTAASLTLEREQNTLESLFCTTLKPHQIAFGKMAGSLSFLMLLVLTGIPALAMPFLLGGVHGTEVVAAVGILLMTAIYLGMIGMLISTMMHLSYRSIIVTYAVLLAVVFIVALPAWPVSRDLISRGGPMWQNTLHVIASLSPLEAMLSLIWKESAYTVGARGMPDFWELFIPISVLLTVVISGIVLFRLRRPLPPPRPREKMQVVERGISARSFFFLIDPRKRKRMIGWWQNPVRVKEFRTRPMLQSQWLLRAVGICLISSVLLMFLVSISVSAFVAESATMFSDMATAVAALMTVLILTVGPAICSGAICTDRETRVWDLIRTTTIPSWRIAAGKFQASIIPLLLLIIAMIPALLILLYFKLELWMAILRILTVVGMTILFVATLGMFFSSLFKRTSTATAWTYAIVVGGGLLTLLILLAEDLFSQRLIRTIFLFNPVAAAMDAAGDSEMQELNLYTTHMRIMAITTASLFVVTVCRVFQLRGRDKS